MRFPMRSDLSAPVSVIVILITTVLIVDPNLASAQKVIINIDGGWRFYPNKSHLSCIHFNFFSVPGPLSTLPATPRVEAGLWSK